MFQVMSQSSRSIVVFADAANIGFPSRSGPHPRNSPERVIGLVMSLIVRPPSSSNEEPPRRPDRGARERQHRVLLDLEEVTAHQMLIAFLRVRRDALGLD